MPQKAIPGRGHKRPQLDVPIERLHLDDLNPRLPESVKGKKEIDVLTILYEEFGLDELAISMAQNGYFDEEPLVVIPWDIPVGVVKKGVIKNNDKFEEFIKKESTHFTVVEGNRRLATARILLSSDLRKKFRIYGWPDLIEDISEDLSLLPVIVYPNRNEVVPYLGVRHIAGIKKWDAYAKARYIVSMLHSGTTVEDIEQQIGDKQGSVRKSSICFNILEQARDEFDFDISNAQDDFSLLILSIGQGNIKRYLGLPVKLKDIPLKNPIKDAKLNELKNFLSWLFGEGKKVPRVIKESRDITNYLTHVVANAESVGYLLRTGDLQAAFDLSDGEETMLKKSLANANKYLEKSLGIVHRHKTIDIKEDVKKCYETAGRLFRTINE